MPDGVAVTELRVLCNTNLAQGRSFPFRAGVRRALEVVYQFELD